MLSPAVLILILIITSHFVLSSSTTATEDGVFDDPLPRLVDCQPPASAQHIAASGPLAPALYVLGDSLLDSGNNNILPTLAKANYLPYGDEFNRCPTGRFTNGRTVADFIAEYLGLPYPPPFIAVRTILGSKWQTTTTGFNYASGSCGILKQTGSNLGKCLSLEEQLTLLNETITGLKRAYPDPTNLSTYLSKSLFLIAVGNNDYINGYFDQNSNLSNLYHPETFSQLLITHLSHTLQRLYNIGARKILVFDVGPLGCLPNMSRRIKHDGPCVQHQNHIVSLYNSKLTPMLTNLTASLPGSHFVLGHAHHLGLDAILNPQKYGLNNTTTPCCKSWNNNTLSCIPGLKSCDNPNEYFFWDGFHLTQSVYHIIAARCIRSPDFCTPINIQHLVQL